MAVAGILLMGVACSAVAQLAPTPASDAPGQGRAVVLFLWQGRPEVGYPVALQGPTAVGLVHTDQRGHVIVTGPCGTPTMLHATDEWRSFPHTSVDPCGGRREIVLLTPSVRTDPAR